MREAIAKKWGPVLPVRLILHQADVGFMDQRCRLQAVTSPLGVHVIHGETAQLTVNYGKDLFAGLPVTAPCGGQQRRDLRRLAVH